MKITTVAGLSTIGLLSVVLIGCADTVRVTGPDYYERRHVVVDHYHRHYVPPRPHYYPPHRVVPYGPRHDGGFIGGGGHPDRPRPGGFIGGTAPVVSESRPAPAPRTPPAIPPAAPAPAPVNGGGGFSGGSASSSAVGS